jgi:glycosyltransferase involved in cell wall biosynthesis
MRDTTEHDSLTHAALRAGSVAAREPLARAAGAASARELIAAARSGELPERVDRWLAGELAHVLALQDLRPGDRADALALLGALHAAGPMTPAHRGLHAQLAFAAGDLRLTAELLDGDVPEPIRVALRVDLGGEDWLSGFQALLPEPAPWIADGPGPRFDRLVSGFAQRVGDAERITTIVTTHRPAAGLLTAVRSLIAQTWTNHEILVVDDGSPAAHDEVLAQAAALDPRVRIIRLPRNAGTYVARNAGLDAASGEYVTFQDSDDWSHPLRLERQVAPLRADAEIFSTTSAGLRVTEDLQVSRVGVTETRSDNLSSLMIRRRLALTRLGHFDPIRRGADTEYVERARAVFGRPATHHLGGAPLALIRISAESLSGDDYRPGWMHPARRSYLSAFQTWHRRVAIGASSAREVRAFAAPRRLRGDAGRERYDVVLAGDWTAAGGVAATGLGQLKALRARGLRAALLHLDALSRLRHGLPHLDPQIQDLVNAGLLDQIELCDDVRARLVVARTPGVLQYAPDGPSRIRADRVVIEATAALPAAGRAARRLFGTDPLWAPTGPDGRQLLSATPGGLALAPVDLPGTVDAAAWRVDRRGPRVDRPVIGRHCAGGRQDWARLRDQLPDPARHDIRLLDGTGSSQRAFGRAGPPLGWLVYSTADVSLRGFLYQVDFYLQLPSEQASTDPEPTVLAAMAAGCVALLPHRFARTFGEAAVYCAPGEVGDTVRMLHGRRTALREQSDRGREFVEQHHGHPLFAERVAGLVE